MDVPYLTLYDNSLCVLNGKIIYSMINCATANFLFNENSYFLSHETIF